MRSRVWQPVQSRRNLFCASVPGMLMSHSALFNCAARFFAGWSLISAVALAPCETSTVLGLSISYPTARILRE